MPKNHTTTQYSFGFTAASLRPELAGVMAELYERLGSWEETQKEVLESNALQCRSKASSIRLEREMRQRLETLSPRQLEMLAHSPHESRVALAWLAAVRRHSFLYDFAVEVLRAKLDFEDRVLRASDYENFLCEKSIDHPETESLSDSTSSKIRRVILRMLREVGILLDGDELGALQRPLVPYEVEQAIREDEPKWLAAFLVPEAQI